jgi:hypothetical protein
MLAANFESKLGPRAVMEVATPEQQAVKPRRGPGFRKGVSGNPKGRRALTERAAELYATMAPDFGELSATDRVLLNQAALLLARSERVHRVRDIDVGVRMSGEARRLLQVLRRHHASAPRDEPTLSEVLRARYGAGRPVDEPEPDPASHTADESAPTDEPAEAVEEPPDDDRAPS